MNNFSDGFIKNVCPDIKYFTDKELTKVPVPLHLAYNIVPTLKVLEYFREKYDRPFFVTSGYRTPEHNLTLPHASKTSKHLIFNAIDFYPANTNDDGISELYCKINDTNWSVPVLWNGTLIEIDSSYLGLGIYDWGLHVDTRVLHGNLKARWDYRTK